MSGIFVALENPVVFGLAAGAVYFVFRTSFQHDVAAEALVSALNVGAVMVIVRLLLNRFTGVRK